MLPAFGSGIYGTRRLTTRQIIPIWAAALIAALVPIAVFFIVQIRVRSFWDMNNAVIGLLYSLIVAAGKTRPATLFFFFPYPSWELYQLTCILLQFSKSLSSGLLEVCVRTS